MNRELRQRLIEAASTDDEFVHYREVADLLELHRHQRLDHASIMNQTLEDISTFEHDHDRPLLTAVVVHQDDFWPGSGFFKMARRVGKQKQGQDNDEFFVAELKRVRDYWQGRRIGLQSGADASNEEVGPVAESYVGDDIVLISEKPYRVVLHEATETGLRRGRRFTEKFRTADNARIRWRVTRRRMRLVPVRWRSCKLWLTLRHAATDKIAAEAMREGRGVVRVRPDGDLLKSSEATGDVIIQEGGTYYIEVSWRSLIKAWEVEVVEPIL